MPIQLVITARLSKGKNFWLRNLTNDLTDQAEVMEIADEYQKHREDNLYQSVMNVIVRANKERFKEATGMCIAILELFEDEVIERERILTERVTQQDNRRNLAQIMKKLNMTAEQAMDVLEIPLEERSIYLRLLK